MCVNDCFINHQARNLNRVRVKRVEKSIFMTLKSSEILIFIQILTIITILSKYHQIFRPPQPNYLRGLCLTLTVLANLMVIDQALKLCTIDHTLNFNVGRLGISWNACDGGPPEFANMHGRMVNCQSNDRFILQGNFWRAWRRSWRARNPPWYIAPTGRLTMPLQFNGMLKGPLSLAGKWCCSSKNLPLDFRSLCEPRTWGNLMQYSSLWQAFGRRSW